MGDNLASEPGQSRFRELAKVYPLKLPRKLKLLLPLKDHIQGLLAKRASYDDIRILLREANIIVSKNTVYRFCREVIGQKPVRQPPVNKKEASQTTPLPSSLANNPTSIQTALQERRERVPSLWGRRKRGPRIADSKNL